MSALVLLAIPLLTAAAAVVAGGRERAERVNIAGAVALLLAGAWTDVAVARHGSIEVLRGQIYVDRLSALMTGAVAVLGFAAALVSIRYLRHDLALGHVPQGDKGVRLYYAGLHAFVWTMLITVSVNNLGLLWVESRRPRSFPRSSSASIARGRRSKRPGSTSSSARSASPARSSASC